MRSVPSAASIPTTNPLLITIDCPTSNLEFIWFNSFLPFFISFISLFETLIGHIKLSAVISGKYFSD